MGSENIQVLPSLSERNKKIGDRKGGRPFLAQMLVPGANMRHTRRQLCIGIYFRSHTLAGLHILLVTVQKRLRFCHLFGVRYRLEQGIGRHAHHLKDSVREHLGV